MLKAVHLPRRHKKRIPRLKAVALITLHKLTMAALYEIQLILRVGLLRIVAAWCIQLGAHAAVGHQRRKALALGPRQL